MANIAAEMTIKIHPDMTEEGKELLRQLIREELARVLAERDKTRGWQPAMPSGPKERK